MRNNIKKVILAISDYISILIATYLTASLVENIIISKNCTGKKMIKNHLEHERNGGKIYSSRGNKK